MEDNEQSVFTVPIPMIGISLRPTDKEIDEWVASYDWDKHEKDLEDEEKIEEEELLMKTTTEEEMGDKGIEIEMSQVANDVNYNDHSYLDQDQGKMLSTFI